nr:uncharacterized protein LOC111420786 [Onthophagus taurus]
MESIPIKPSLSKEEQKCEDHFKSTYQRADSGRFIVSLPFKSDKPSLGHSYQTALKRFHSLEYRFSKNVELRNDYTKFMNDYISSEHMSIISGESTKSPLAYYIPHHCVLRAESACTKLRVVFDASARSSNGKSLNDNLLIGPKLQQDIMKILLNFRCFKYAFICDIKQMYRQILHRPQDRDYQRIIWRSSPDKPIQEYRLNTVTYGLASSPFLALRTILELSNLYSQEFPMASESLKHHIYVDDIVTGASTIDDLLKLQKELIMVLQKGGFELRKWASNNERVLSSVPISDQLSTISFECEEINCVKVLGLQWNPVKDTFTYSYTARVTQCTKRTILSEIARIYDPLGFLTPCTLKAKHLIQQLWQLKTSWDDSPPEFIKTSWNMFKSKLPLLSKFNLSRSMILDNPTSIQLHLFCDASQIGYCAVAYIRTTTNENKCYTHFVCAKARVAPLKVISIPRLELCAALLLTELFEHINEVLSHKIQFESIYAWSDSQVVLSWLASPAQRWKVFVANRVTKIQEILPINHWRHVPSLNNPADCGSRGLFPDQLINSDLWWQGPSWLCDHSDNWPSSPSMTAETKDTIEEQRQLFINAIVIESHIFDTLLNRFSSLSKIKRIIVYCKRFILHCQRKKKSFSMVLSPFELQGALYSLIQHVQTQTFSFLFTAIRYNKPVPKPFHSLSPFVDRDGLIRVGGRLKQSELPFDQTHPVLLPRNSRLSELIVEEVHREFLHPGYRTVLSLVMQQFWIMGSRFVIHRVLSRCIPCFKMKPRSYAPVMSDLPKFRIEEIKPFSKAAVDFAGPVFTTLNRSRGSKSVKSYICVFVCTATKAIHLELVSGLSTDAFLAALRRFVSRRGRCSILISDQGTNFIGCNNRLKEMAEIVGVKLGLEWKFNPPGAPHFNGLAESNILIYPRYLAVVSIDGSFYKKPFKIFGNVGNTTTYTHFNKELNGLNLHPIPSSEIWF